MELACSSRPPAEAAIAITMPKEGDLILELPPRGGGAKTINAEPALHEQRNGKSPGGARYLRDLSARLVRLLR